MRSRRSAASSTTAIPISSSPQLAHALQTAEALSTERDRTRLAVLRHWERYDLYTKSPDEPAWSALRPFCEDRVAALLPADLPW